MPPSAAPAAPSPPIRHATGVFAGFVLLAAVNAAAIAVRVPLPKAGLGLRLLHHLFDAAETLGVGGLAALAVGGFARFVRVPRWAAILAAAAATAPFLYFALNDYVRQLAVLTFEGPHAGPLHVTYAVILCFAVPVAYLLGHALSARPRLRLGAVAAAIAALAGGQLVLPDDYFGIHCVCAWGALTLGGAALAPLAERAARALAPRRAGLAAIGGVALLGVVVPPPNAVRVELFRQPCALAPWLLAGSVWRPPALHAPAAAPASPWFQDRTGLAAIPPTSPRLLPEGPVVILVSVDALRADAVLDPANDELFPTLARIKRTGVVFPNATAPASQTALSLGTTFASRYPSQLQWAKAGRGSNRYRFPRYDPTPRFPEILSGRGVKTFHNASVSFLADEYGVVRGFEERRTLVRVRQHARARELVDPLIERLGRAGPEPLFAYAHLTEPHAPYNRGRKDGTPWQRYLSEIAVADKHLGRLVKAAEERLGDRWVLVVTADHGEAFGAHGLYEHGKSLYQELVHVPLLVLGPRVAARVVEQRVGLIDLGPTVLDLFGVPAPGAAMGESLVPLLAGREVTLARPLISEGKLRRALTRPDGLKVIEDPQHTTVEVFDLRVDPNETRNLFDVDPGRADAALAELRAWVWSQRRSNGVYEQDGEL